MINFETLRFLKEINLATVTFSEAFSPAPEPGQHGKDDAEQDAGRDRKIETRVAVLVGDVARQPPQPAEPASRPDPRSRRRDDEAEDEDDFAEVLHGDNLAQFR